MVIVAVDDEYLMLQNLIDCIKDVVPDALIVPFQKATEAEEYVKEHDVDIVFLDIQMRGTNGIELAKKIKMIHPLVNFIFCTGYDEYIMEAVNNIRCSGYLLKPITSEQVRNELNNLRNPIAEKPNEDQKLVVKCFGNFEVFYNGTPLNFSVAKSKEMFAYLIDRSGSMCTNSEIVSVLWEDGQSHFSYFKKMRKGLVDTFVEIGLEDVLIFNRGCMGIQKDKIDCDFYKWNDNLPEGINAYHGEYMTQYGWAANTKNMIEKKS